MKKAVLLIAICCILLAACSSESSEDGEKSRNGFLEYEAKALNGDAVSFKELLEKNELTIINIWATFCGPCIDEMPELEEIYKEHSGRIGVIGICADVSDSNGKVDEKLLETAKKIADSDLELTYISVVPSAEMQKEFLNELTAYPKTYIVNAEGKVLETFYGKRSKEQFLELAEKYL